MLKNLARHNLELKTIKENFASKIKALETDQTSDITLIKDRQKLKKDIIQIKAEINKIIESASSNYEKTMYFRMASWFMEDAESTFGRLPQKADYNKSHRYIFAPLASFWHDSRTTCLPRDKFHV